MLKNKIRTLVTANKNFSSDDQMYLRTVLKLEEVYATILNHQAYPMSEKDGGLEIDADHLNNILQRLTRRCLIKPMAGKADNFCVSPGAYSFQKSSCRQA